MFNKNIGLILAIVFASVAISGSLIFFGLQFGSKVGTGEVTTEKIEQAFESYAKKQQQGQAESKKQAFEDGQESKNALAKTNLKKVSKTEDHIRGNPDAKISLIEYSDFECSFCKRFHATGKQVVDSYGGKVNWVYRHFPLEFHDPLATKQAIATECANELGGNDKFWEMTDLIFEITTSGGRGMEVDELPNLASKIGLDKNKFTECFESGKYDTHIQQDIEEGSRAGIKSTPGNLVLNNETGAVTVSAVQ